MCPEHSDIQMYADLAELNLGFLTLMIEEGASRAASALGLEPAIIEQLRRLTSAELEFIAGTPGLLACFSRFVPGPVHHVADRPDAKTSAQLPAESVWWESARLYVIGLLAYLWRLEQHRAPSCTLCAQSAESALAPIADFDFARIRSSADLAVERLRARFVDHPSFWIDLIRSARSGNEDFRALSRLAVIPLLLAEECSAG